MRMKTNASGRQIHCRAALLMINEVGCNTYEFVLNLFGDEETAIGAQIGAELRLLNQLENRLNFYTVGELIDWERDHGFDPNRELTRRKHRVDDTYDPMADLQQHRRALKEW